MVRGSLSVGGGSWLVVRGWSSGAPRTRDARLSVSPPRRFPASPGLYLVVSSLHRFTGDTLDRAAFPRHEHILNSSTAPNLPSPNLRQKSGEVLGSGASVVGTRPGDARIEPVRALVVAPTPARQAGAAPGSLRDGRTP
jgi:hypothetical protein